jgi:hypothetical protein
MRAAPGHRTRERQRRQPQCFRQAARRRERRPGARDGEAGEPPARIERKAIGDLRAVEALETFCDIRQKRLRDCVTAEDTAPPATR